MSEFNLSGKTIQRGEFWGAEIILTTPDGKQTKIESGLICKTDTEAAALLQHNMDRLLSEFRKDGTEVIFKNGVALQ